MVKPYAHKLQGTWLKAEAEATIGNAAHRFNGEADPLYARRVADTHKSEAQRRAEAAQAIAATAKDQIRAKRQYSTPAPVLKPRSQKGRRSALQGSQSAPVSSPTSSPKTASGEQNKNGTTWLKAQYEASVKAVSANQNQSDTSRLKQQFNTQANQQAPPSGPSQSPTR